ncbi:uncharacterized protein FIBRA_04865 [Fibroporia radiculosa]|uniref:30S ribosomal protein S15 n=1 Tax=Fibroporia radiculosa TaxID=599839 RepID=J4HWS2_9APHY|nr:uncharacterized protein FIBRA_04865 [Fibroporia radiculosa]CCM02757.1 predicted protein [Fibroporia radiculosa]
MRKRKSRVAEKANVEKRQQREQLAKANRPHIILGNRPDDVAKWKDCDLAKVIVTEEDILASPIPPIETTPFDESQLPKYFNFGVGDREKELLFDTLPSLTLEGVTRIKQSSGRVDVTSRYQQAEPEEALKTSTLARLVDLRNANARGIAYENRKRIIAEFSESENPMDTGRPEVQAALLTLRIRKLWDHLSKFKKDIGNRRSLRRLVHQRARILRYLKQVDRDRYDRVLERIGLEPESVEGELVV